MVVTTAGSEHDAYRSGGRNRFTVDELLRPYQASAVHAGMVQLRTSEHRSMYSYVRLSIDRCTATYV